MIDQCKIAGRLRITMRPHALVNCGEVVEHAVGPVYFFLEKAKQVSNTIFGYPNCWYVIERVLKHDGATQPIGNLLRDGEGGDHTWSGSLSTISFCRAGCIRSQRDGIGARTVSCDPTTQLSGRRSAPMAFCNNSSPSRKASGRGGQPGT